MEKEQVPGHPSPYVFGCQYAKKTILSITSPLQLVDTLKAIIANTDFRVLRFVLNMLTTQKGEVSRPTTKALIEHFKSTHGFRNVVTGFMNDQNSFPDAFMSQITKDAAFVLAVYGCSTKFEKECREFLRTNILPSLKDVPEFYVDKEMLFELCSLNMDPFTPTSLFNSTSSMDLMMYASQCGKVNTCDLRLECANVGVSMKSVVTEADITLLTSATRIQELFNFYQGFDHTHAAVFLLSIVSQGSFSKFCDSIEPHQRYNIYSIYRDAFAERKVDLSKMVYALDQPDFEPLDESAAMLMFNMICWFFEKQLIPSDAFTCEWNNKQLQWSFLYTLSKNNVPNIDFSKSRSLLNVHQLDLQPNTFSNCNNCWMSLEFSEIVIRLGKDDVELLYRIFGQVIKRYSSVILAIFGQTNIPRTPAILDIGIDAFMKVMQMNNSQQVFTSLWRTSAQFLKDVLVRMYRNQPESISTIADLVNGQITSLYDCSDMRFVVDLVIYACKHGKGNFSDFLSLYTSKSSRDKLLRILDILREKITDPTATPNTIPDVVLNSLFSYLSRNFESYPIEMRVFIQETYDVCKRMQSEINNFTFEATYSAAKLKEIKKTAAENFSKLLGNEVTVPEFMDMVKEYRTKDPKLLSCMTHFLLKEFPFLEQHSAGNVKKLADITGQLISEKLVTLEAKAKTQQFMMCALKDKDLTVRFQFAARVLDHILPLVSNDPQFVFDMVHDSTLRYLDPVLFEKAQKVAQTLYKPSRPSVTKTINVHPLLKRFDNLVPLPPRVYKAMQAIQKDGTTLGSLLETYGMYSDWFAQHIVNTVLDQPKLMNMLVKKVNEAGSFWKCVFQAATAQTLQIVLSPKIDQYEGAFLRRRLLLLGNLIGSITLAVNRPILARFLDLKKLLMYGFSQGKLYAVVPFVTRIFMLASGHFGFRNPYTAGILQILASVMSADSIKLTIKHHIQTLFQELGVSLSMFASIPEIFPEKVQNNFDFVLPPFSLRNMTSSAELERILMFDENAFTNFVSTHVVFPDFSVQLHPDFKEKTKEIIANIAYQYSKTEATSLAKIASSTSIELILKDFASAQETDLMMEDATILTKQLVSSLVMCSAPTKITRHLSTRLHKENSGAPAEWLDLVAHKNYEWIVQFVKDIIETRALREMHRKVDKSEEVRANILKQKPQSMFPIFPATVQGLTYQQQQVYSELSELSLSQQPFPDVDVQSKDKQVAIDAEFDEYLIRFQKLVSLDFSIDNPDDPVTQLLGQMPDLGGKTLPLARFQSILKTILKWSIKVAQPNFDNVVCHVLSHVCRSVPHQDIVNMQPYVMIWVRTSLRSCPVIRQLFVQGLVTIEQLDKLFTELLNADPFNSRTAFFIVKFLAYAIFEVNLFQGDAVVSTLSSLCAVNEIELETAQIPPSVMHTYDELRKLFNEMDAPDFQFSSSSKLQRVSTFDPLEDVQDPAKISDAIKAWKATATSSDPKKEEIEEATKACNTIGKTLFTVLFLNEKENICIKFVRCMLEFIGVTSDFQDAIVAVIGGNANVIGFDMRKYYTILRVLLDHWNDTTSFAILLHRLRPLVMPSFALDWIELATDKHIIYDLLKTNTTWLPYSVLMMDFIACLTKIDTGKNQTVFTKLYNAFLRYILVLTHDFRNFVVAMTPTLLVAIPFHFTQIRNIILSTSDKSTESVQPLQAYSLEASLPHDLISAIDNLFSTGSYNSAALNAVLTQLESIKQPGAVRYFIARVCKGSLGMKKSDDVEDTQGFKVLSEVFNTISADLAVSTANTLIDQVRYKCKESYFHVKLIIALTKTSIQVTPQLSLAEILVRAVVERAVTPSPRPVKLNSLVRKLLSDKPMEGTIMNMPFVKSNERVKDFLSAAYAVCASKQSK